MIGLHCLGMLSIHAQKSSSVNFFHSSFIPSLIDSNDEIQ